MTESKTPTSLTGFMQQSRSEVEILNGAQKTLRRFRPVMWVEVQSEQEAAIQSLLSGIGYQVERREIYSDLDLAFYWLLPVEREGDT